ncbi:hypothetical protein [Mycobacterium dioxanotrophicus]|uniref:hypothetical protein n=1 Tax=Mycobacterium dioxanotrophicus TaxID=482462 RepID=UPI0012F771CD|nr:hypothetical protein [Mycobacterium dioxanotrophicus]
MDEYAEDLTGPQLPPEVEEYLAGEREWHRLLRRTRAVTPEEAAEMLMPRAGQ